MRANSIKSPSRFSHARTIHRSEWVKMGRIGPLKHCRSTSNSRNAHGHAGTAGQCQLPTSREPPLTIAVEPPRNHRAWITARAHTCHSRYPLDRFNWLASGHSPNILLCVDAKRLSDQQQFGPRRAANRRINDRPLSKLEVRFLATSLKSGIPS